MPLVLLRAGNPNMVDYVTPGIVSMGDVIIVNDTPRIAHHDFPSGVLGALAAVGGVYEATSDAAILADKKVYWDPALKKASQTPGTLKVLGVSITAASGADQPFLFRHDPAA